MLLKALILILLLVLAPYGTGLLISGILEPEQRSMGITYIFGFLVSLAAFQLVAVPVVFLDAWGFDLILRLFSAVSAVLAGGGTVYAMHSWRKGKRIWSTSFTLKDMGRIEQVQWGMVLILVAFQMVMAVTHASFDGDDAYYLVQSVIAQETDVLYRKLPYTGLSTSLDHRHAMAVFPLWIAYLARMSDIHSTIMSHTILPLVLIPLTYWIYLEIGKKMLKEKKELVSMFMLLVCTLQIFGNTSIYTSSTFFLTRTWQGKSMLANVVIPAIFLILLWIFDKGDEKKRKNRGSWVLLFVLNVVAAMMSTASVFLNILLLGVMGIVLAIREKDLKICLKIALTCIPCVCYGLIYMLL